MGEPSADFIVLRDSMYAIHIMEVRLEELANIDNAECLRTCADALQVVRERYYPQYLAATEAEMRREREEAGGDG